MDPRKRFLFQEKWRALPESARTPNQTAGVAATACGATHGVMERCNLACTSCYLSDVANDTRPLPFEEVAAQLDVLRRDLGEGARVQITSGEVTLLPVGELGRIVAYARAIGLDPMVMSNGVRFLKDPDYLRKLVEEHGLRKVSIHVDVTQVGRPALDDETREADLFPLRDRYASLIRDVRRRTGARLHGAQTVTVTRRNLEDVPAVVERGMDHADAFRILSFLPAASVGRTLDEDTDVTLEEVWERICRPFGRTLNRDALHFGHRDCNITVPVVLVTLDGAHEAVEVVRAGSRMDERTFSAGLRGLSNQMGLDGKTTTLVRRTAFALFRRPLLTARLAVWMAARAWSERRLAARLVLTRLRGKNVRIRPFLLVAHAFMTAEELATPRGRERLAACVFQVAVGDELVSMCELNASGRRRELDAQRLDSTKKARSLSVQS